MNAEELIKNGEVHQALVELKKQIQKKPADGKLRVFLYQLFCITGDYSRALTQLNLCSEMKALDELGCAAGKMLLQNQALREEVFSGKKTPLVFGEPADWIGELIQSCAYIAQGDYAAAQKLRDKSFESAPASGGTINGQKFEWIADGDTRLGPCLEVIVEGKYYWMPFVCISSLEIEEVKELRDLVWAESSIVLKNGGKVFAYLPARYSGLTPETSEDIMLSRKTEWEEKDGDCWLGSGQKMLATDGGDFPLLEVRKIIFAD